MKDLRLLFLVVFVLSIIGYYTPKIITGLFGFDDVLVIVSVVVFSIVGVFYINYVDRDRV